MGIADEIKQVEHLLKEHEIESIRQRINTCRGNSVTDAKLESVMDKLRQDHRVKNLKLKKPFDWPGSIHYEIGGTDVSISPDYKFRWNVKFANFFRRYEEDEVDGFINGIELFNELLARKLF